MILTTEKYAQAIDKSVFPGIQGGPFMHTIAAKAVAFGEALTPAFKAYQAQVIINARAMGEELQRTGVRLVGGGTDTHLLLVDLTPKNLTGKAVEQYLDEIAITVNKNAIPVRPAKTDGHQRYPDRFARDHIARLRRSRCARGRRDHWGGAR